ncbi:MAG: DUF6206 family protein [Longimicrobiales bacterium]|nr:DUF6206 family protein [Longimicrobiales bacterium]
MSSISDAELAELDARVIDMMRTGVRNEVEIIGAGEMACVIGLGDHALKRLPPVSERARLESYGALVDEYVAALEQVGVRVAETEWRIVSSETNQVAYIIQERVSAASLMPDVVRCGTETEAVALLEQVLDHVDACVLAGIGIDPQLSNWSIRDGRPLLLDITTPMLRDEKGRDRLDTELFVAMLPALIRGFVRRFMIGEILDKNFNRHGILLDLIGNIVNYGLGHLTPVFLPAINARLEQPLTMKEVRAYRRSEHWTWSAIRRAFRVEQFWKRRVLRQPTSHLLPSEYLRGD